MKNSFIIFSRKLLLNAIFLSFSLVCVNIILSTFNIYYSKLANETLKNTLNYNKNVMNIIIGTPLMETILIQYLIINQINISLKHKSTKFISIFISTILFGAFHAYNLQYFIFAIFIGFILANYFYILNSKYNSFTAFFYTFMVHCLFNFQTMILKTYF
jgi:hypothetical protein